MQTLRHLVCGIDFSAFAEEALDLTLSLAISTGARITLVHVCELGVDDIDDERFAACAEALAAVVERNRRENLEISAVLRCGKPWEKLDNVAAEVGATLIVIGRHGGGRGPVVPIGSVAERLVRSANRPVLTVGSDAETLDRLGSKAP